ncbi:MAG: hypothetical protein ACK2UK_22545 [Candidatus Promineifilaceae bacterium]
MDRDRTALTHDLLILGDMVAAMPAYLDSDVQDWTLPHTNMPPLTIGGCLMRMLRLDAVQGKLTNEEREELTAVCDAYHAALQERVVRFEKRAHQELHTRIAEWIACLRDFSRRAATEQNFYAGIVDTRVVIEHLTDALCQAPYELQPGIEDEIKVIDRMLADRLTKGSFVWDTFWEAAYPREKYWWLYRHPALT